MYPTASGYELRKRFETDDAVAGTTGVADSRRTVAGAAVLSAFPVAFVVAASYPVVAAAMVTTTVATVVAGRAVRERHPNPFGEPDPDDGTDGTAPVASPTD